MEKDHLPRQLLGISTLLYLYQTRPETYGDQIITTQRALTGVVHSFIQMGRQNEILPAIGPLPHTLLTTSMPSETELGSYLQTISKLEPETQTPPLNELIAQFDNVIILLGKRASGKGTITELLAKHYGITGMPTSDWLRAIASARNYPEPFDPVMLRELGDDLRDKFGGEVLVRLTLQQHLLQGKRHTVFDGLRSKSEMLPLVDRNNVASVWVEASDDIRLKRVIKRNRSSDPKTYKDLLSSDKKSFPEADELKRMCGHIMLNETDDPQALKVEVDRLMQTLQIEKPKQIVEITT